MLVVQNRAQKEYSDEDVEVLQATAMVVAEHLVSGAVAGAGTAIELEKSLSAVIQGEQIDSRDTRPKGSAAPTTKPAEAAAEPEEAKRPNTFLLLAAGVVVLIVLGGASFLVIWWRRRSARIRPAARTPDQTSD